MNNTNPTGIRYNKEKVELIKKLKNLPTFQKVVNFLVDDFYEKHTTGFPEISNVPTHTRNEPCNSLVKKVCAGNCRKHKKLNHAKEEKHI